jgi:hypothetical protein
VVYINGSPVYTSATGLTSLSSVTVTPGVAGPWAVNVYAYNSGYALIASRSYTGIENLTLTGSTTFLSYRGDYIAMNDAATKMIFSSWNNATPLFYYSYFNGTSWTTPATFGTATTSTYQSVELTADGTRGIIGNSFFTWTGTTPTAITTIAASTTCFSMINADGSRLVQYNGTNWTIYTWNGTSYVSSTTISLANLTSTSVQISMSPDGSRIMYIVGPSVTDLCFATWNGTTYVNETRNVSAAWNNFSVTYSTVEVRSIRFGYQNTVFINTATAATNGSRVISLGYNTASGYYDKYFTVVLETGALSTSSTSGIAVPRLISFGAMFYSYSGTIYVGALTIT